MVNYLDNHPELISREEAIKRPQPLRQFDEYKHKMLNSELKFLYTALTRARCNLWIYDSNEDKRSPMFYYFQKRGLVRTIYIAGGQCGESLLSNEEIFAKKSSKEDWEQQGNYFKRRNNWDLAIFCYTKADREDLVKETHACRHMWNGTKSKNKNDIIEMKNCFLRAALSFFRSFNVHPRVKSLEKAASCLFNAHEYKLSAKLFVKLKKVSVKIYYNHKLLYT